MYKNEKNNHKIWRYWNPKKKLSAIQRTYFNKKNKHEKLVVSDKVSFGKKRFKYFIGYKDAS